MKQKKKPWKTVFIVIVLLGLLSTCASPTAEQEKPRGTLPSAAVSERVETEPPASKPIPTRAPVEPTATPEPDPTPTPTPELIEETPEPTPEPIPVGSTYILNTNTYKFHKPSCSSVGQMNSSNRRDFTGTRETNRTSDPSLRSGFCLLSGSDYKSVKPLILLVFTDVSLLAM